MFMIICESNEPTHHQEDKVDNHNCSYYEAPHLDPERTINALPASFGERFGHREGQSGSLQKKTEVVQFQHVW